MSKKLFKRLVAAKTAELRKWASRYGITFKTTSEIEREKAVREREQDRLSRQRGESSGGNEGRTGRNKRNNRQKRNA